MFDCASSNRKIHQWFHAMKLDDEPGFCYNFNGEFIVPIFQQLYVFQQYVTSSWVNGEIIHGQSH